MSNKYMILYAFFYAVLKDVSSDYFALFKDLLAELGITEEGLRKANIEDEALRNALKDIDSSKKIHKALKQYEPPRQAREYMDDFLEGKRIKAREFFSRLEAKEDDVEIKMESDLRLKIKAKRGLFPRDKRLLPADSDVYEFELSCFYRKDASRLEITFSTRIKVEESRIPDMNAANFTVFDDFAKAIGLDGFDKNIQFDAVYSEGQTLFDNTCEAYWMKTLKIKSAPSL